MKIPDYYEYLMSTDRLDNIDKDVESEIEDFIEEDLDLSDLDINIDDDYLDYDDYDDEDVYDDNFSLDEFEDFEE